MVVSAAILVKPQKLGRESEPELGSEKPMESELPTRSELLKDSEVRKESGVPKEVQKLVERARAIQQKYWTRSFPLGGGL